VREPRPASENEVLLALSTVLRGFGDGNAGSQKNRKQEPGELAGPMRSKEYVLMALVKLGGRFTTDDGLRQIKDLLAQNQSSIFLELQARSTEYSAILKVEDAGYREQLVEHMPPLELLSDMEQSGIDRASLAGGGGVGASKAAPAAAAKPDVSVDLVDLLGGDLLGGGGPGPGGTAPVSGMAQPSPAWTPEAGGGLDGLGAAGGPAGGGGDLLDLLGGGGGPTPAVPPGQGMDGLGAPTPTGPPPPRDAKAALSSMLDESLFSTPTQPQQQMGGQMQPNMGGGPTPNAPAAHWGQQPQQSAMPAAQGFPPILAFQSSQSGLTLHFSFAKPNPGMPNVTVITMNSSNNGGMEISHLNVQVAVPKFMQLAMRPPSGDTLPVGGGISQLVEVNNSMHGTKQLAVKLKIEYMWGGQPIAEMTTVSAFPPGL